MHTLTLANFNASVYWDLRDPELTGMRPVNHTPRESAFLCPRDLVKRWLISPRGVALLSLLIISLVEKSFVMMTDGPFNQRNERKLLETNCAGSEEKRNVSTYVMADIHCDFSHISHINRCL